MRGEVDKANFSRLNALSGESRTYTAEDGGDESPEQRDKLLENMMAPKQLVLKVGSQVMLIKNKSDDGLVNGSTGTVVRFAPPGAAPGPFGDGDDSDSEMVYTGGHEFDVKPAVKAEAAEKMAGLKKMAIKSVEEVPWVEWALADGRKTAAEPVAREEFKVEQGEIVKARRKQVRRHVCDMFKG